MGKSRSLIIFGNGLGMALDNQYFTLKKAMANTWFNSNVLSNEHKKLIQDCLASQNSKTVPMCEEDLGNLHGAVIACKLLNIINTGDVHLLTDLGKEFPMVTQEYLTNVAWYFHHSGKELPIEFLDPLYRFIRKTKSHVATLNYDNLLYQKFIEERILDRYNSYLIDGFWDETGFAEENLLRKFNHDFGYYLHLHGSPLYVESKEKKCIIKQKQGEAIAIPTDHLVLAHVNHKRMIIDYSDVLKVYWKFLNRCILESKNIFVFGYSGQDDHLNNMIANYSGKKQIIVIEWDGTNKLENRQSFWENAFGSKKITLVSKNNILEFTEWIEYNI